MNQRCALGLISALAFGAAAGNAYPQSNTVPGMDVGLFSLGSVKALGREGTFPDGVSGCAIATTSCNPGSVKIPWFEPMNPNHPFISPILAREMNGRFVQISDRSYIKHGFFATNLDQCGTCQYPGSGNYLGINCSDTYSTNNNGDNYYLGPPDEIDPWLGVWDPICSHFDKGEPPVPPPADCDGKRSFTEAQADALGPVGHRVRVLDQDFNFPDATYYFQGMYTITGEAESLRDNNLCTRFFIPSWNGSRWILTVPSTGNTQVYGSILQRWSGATVTSNTNGGDDGRVYVAVRVTGPDHGLYHYEYAVHNRDNQRGVATFRVPVCSSARVLNLGFRDVDQDATNDWTAARSATEIEFSTLGNPLLWNSFYNFWFDSDAAPAAGDVLMDQFKSGTGAPMITVGTTAPVELNNVYLGDGCSAIASPLLFATGNPDKALLGNATFGLQITGNAPLSLSFLIASGFAGTTALTGTCNLYMAPTGILILGVFPADGTGTTTIAAPIPNDPSLEGVTVYVQTADAVAGGALWSQYDLSNGLAVRIGNTNPGCP